MPQKPWPPERTWRPLKKTWMSSQWWKSSPISAADSASAARRFASVWSLSTTPQPKVSKGRLRSTTVIWRAGLRAFISSAKYRPAGPPPMHRMRWRSMDGAWAMLFMVE